MMGSSNFRNCSGFEDFCKAEFDILMDDGGISSFLMNKALGLYIHIPFCSVKCRFCHFAAYPGLRSAIPEYLAALEKEMESFRGKTVQTLFVGGGTPSLLEPEQIESLFASVRLNTAERAGENLMLALRLKEGARITQEAERHYGNVLKKYQALRLLRLSAGRARLTRKGWILSNQIFRELLELSPVS